MENDSNLLSLVPEVEWLICYDWGGFDRPASLLHFLTPTVSVGCLVFSFLFFSFLLLETMTRLAQESNRGRKCRVAEEERVVTARLDVLKAAVRKILLVLLVCCRQCNTFCNVHT